jgi:response regulator RpfG family c-di-GMP phosphodiesterase
LHRVLIVEDQVPVARLLRAWIEADGLTAVAATGAEQALVVAGEQPLAVAFCDIKLPGGRDGFWLVDQLRVLRPETAIVMTTGLQHFDAAVVLMRAGVTDYLVKPFTWARFRQALQRALAEHRSRAGEAAVSDGDEAQAPQVPESATAALRTVLEAQGGTSVQHAQRVASLSTQLARALGTTEPEVSLIECAALLCSVERLDIHSMAPNVPHLKDASAIAVAVREHFDGTGFPRGLKGEAIPKGARIVAVARAYEELISGFRTRVTAGDAVAQLCGKRAAQFDPAVLDALKTLEPQLQPTPA